MKMLATSARERRAASRWEPVDIVRASALAALIALEFTIVFLSAAHSGHAHAESLAVHARIVETLLVFAVGFYFGSSQGSKDKGEAINRIAESGDGAGHADRMQVDADSVEMRVAKPANRGAAAALPLDLDNAHGEWSGYPADPPTL